MNNYTLGIYTSNESSSVSLPAAGGVHVVVQDTAAVTGAHVQCSPLLYIALVRRGGREGEEKYGRWRAREKEILSPYLAPPPPHWLLPRPTPSSLHSSSLTQQPTGDGGREGGKEGR